MDEGIEIVRFTEADISFGKALTDAEGWHRTIADWKRLMAISPSGLYKAKIRGTDAGIAGLLPFDKVAWIHSIIVVKEMRSQGIGRSLMRFCVQRAKDMQLPCVKLDSVKGYEGFYKSFGFVEEFESKRLLRDGEHFTVSAEHIDQATLDRVLYFDKAQTGLNRSRAIRAVYEDSPELSFCVRGESGLKGYIMARRGDERIQIGPCVVDKQDAQCASSLITSLVGSEQYSGFRMCVPGANAAAVRLAMDLGFKGAASSTRMFLGSKFEESNACFAMFSAEKG